MQSTKPRAADYILGVLLVVLLVGSFTWFNNTVDVDVPSADDIASKIVIPSCDLGNLTNQVQDVQNTLDEDEDWKDEALLIATEEWEDRDYKEIYKAIEDIFGDIDDRDDIEKVVIKDEEVTSFDVDDEDANVVQEVKVYYEDVDGDDKKVYLTIETEIEEGEIEDQDIFETP